MKTKHLTPLLLTLLVASFISQEAFTQNSFDIPEGYIAERNIVYSTTPEKDLLLDIYYMKDAEESLPLIIWIHGGAWRGGSEWNGYVT